ncbi:MAG: serine/threonine-protein phosphatase, partial [Planctomycetes bacterium]|nr:serine/threonine-protein phosphatase [Planctomycetota bacterium]
VASKIALEQIEKSLKQSLLSDNSSEALQVAIAKANAEIYRLAKDNPVYSGMGTTLVAALVFDNHALIANVGDSRAYVIGDETKQITKDHSLVQELSDKKIITEEEAFGHPQKNIVTRTIGTKRELVPDIYEEDISGKVLLLCSDGLSDMVRDHEMLETIASSETLDYACDALIDLANANGGKDNITAVLAKLR